MAVHIKTLVETINCGIDYHTKKLNKLLSARDELLRILFDFKREQHRREARK